MTPPLLFMHITKTAGGSLMELIRASSDKIDVHFHYREEPSWKRNFDYPNMHELFFGHFLFGVHEMLKVQPRYACFVREPVARTISHYNHLIKNDRGRVGDKARKFRDLESYLREGRSWEMDNLMCRMISGVVILLIGVSSALKLLTKQFSTLITILTS